MKCCNEVSTSSIIIITGINSSLDIDALILINTMRFQVIKIVNITINIQYLMSLILILTSLGMQ